ncbi:cytochrome c oxidase assembly protein [Streptomyces sp. NPDC057445]|uniref:cytochrome c oxidase assembly protein n=1 Tax=Streptomyces sp. NPDC057445 TaxID=3346136 RepID=UPI0036CDD39F
MIVLLAAGYLLLASRARSGNPRVGWSRWRTGLFLAGCALLAVAVLPPAAPFAHGDFRGHMLQHLLIGMYAPLALILGAPSTLLLRTLPAQHGRRMTRLVRSRPLQVVANPVTVLVLSVGTLGLLYCTPLFNATARQPVLHWLLHAHFLLAGCLFAWVIAGPGPAPARPSVPTRLVVLGTAIAAHAVIAQLLYGGFLINVHARLSARSRTARRSCTTAAISPSFSWPSPSSPPGTRCALPAGPRPGGTRPTQRVVLRGGVRQRHAAGFAVSSPKGGTTATVTSRRSRTYRRVGAGHPGPEWCRHGPSNRSCKGRKQNFWVFPGHYRR